MFVGICLSSFLSPERGLKKSSLSLYMFNFLLLNFIFFVEEIHFFVLHLYNTYYGDLLISQLRTVRYCGSTPNAYRNHNEL